MASVADDPEIEEICTFIIEYERDKIIVVDPTSGKEMQFHNHDSSLREETGKNAVEIHENSPNLSKLNLLRLPAVEKEGFFGDIFDNQNKENESEHTEEDKHILPAASKSPKRNRKKSVGSQTPEAFNKFIQIKKEYTPQVQYNVKHERESNNIALEEQLDENLMPPASLYEHNHRTLQKCRKIKENNKLNCGECNFECLKKVDLKKHMKKEEHFDNHEDVSNQCTECTFSSRSQRIMRRHVNAHQVQPLYFCEICNLDFPSKKSQEMHVLKMHVEGIYKFMDKHTNKGHVKGLFKCKYCGSKFSSLHTKSIHMKEHHFGNYENFICSICNFQCNITSKVLVNKHKHMHKLREGKVYYVTNEKELMPKKRKIGKSYVCPECDVKLAFKTSMKKHLLIHSNKRPFKCLECGAKFRQKGHLKSHTTIHTKVKPFGCSKCNYRGINISLVKRHMILHSNVRPYGCGDCTSRFKRRHKLMEHIVKFHGKKYKPEQITS